MLDKIIPNLKFDSIKLVAAKFTLLTSFFIAGFFSIFHYVKYDALMFYSNLILLSILSLSMLIFLKKDIYFKVKVVLTIMLVSIVIIIYASHGRDGIYLWIFIGIFYLMVTFGYKTGFWGGILFLLVVFFIMYDFIGESITYKGFVRYVLVSIILFIIAYSYEYSRDIGLEKLNKVNDELEKLSRVDGLTGLYNRRYFDEIFEVQLKVAKREGKLFAFIMLDIDNFKPYNDTYGHLSGDRVLQEVSKSIKDTLKRPNDFAFRLGGEEFGVIVCVANIEDSIQIAQKIRADIEDLKIGYPENPVSTYVTVSVGVFALSGHERYERDEIYKMADDALYDAKQKGKNRVELSKFVKI